ncbi:MAG: AmmeMemoRadiSam system protein B [Candidatus Magasanikbacteria bacterium]
MKIRIALYILFATVASLAIVVFIRRDTTGFNVTPDVERNLTTIALHDMFYDEYNFNQAIRKAEGVESEKNISAIVVPHHLLVSEYIAALIKKSFGRPIDYVIIIGPNHQNVGSNALSSAHAQWGTPFGSVQTDAKMVDAFLDYVHGYSQTYVFEEEHSVGAIVPFIKHYLPQARIVPIVINSYATHADAEKLSDWLATSIGGNYLIIVSTDFSHYLDKTTADRNDLYTRELIEKGDTIKITTLNNDYVDSPVSLATVLLFAQKKGLTTDIVYNSNSFDFLTNKPSETTSYFGIVFRDTDSTD